MTVIPPSVRHLRCPQHSFKYFIYMLSINHIYGVTDTVLDAGDMALSKAHKTLRKLIFQ